MALHSAAYLLKPAPGNQDGIYLRKGSESTANAPGKKASESLSTVSKEIWANLSIVFCDIVLSYTVAIIIDTVTLSTE